MATITKQYTSVEVHTLCDYTATADDHVVAGVGSAVWAMLVGRHDVLFKDGDKDVFIPFHAVCYAEKTITSEEVEKPEDEFCKPIEVCPEDGGEGGDEP